MLRESKIAMLLMTYIRKPVVRTHDVFLNHALREPHNPVMPQASMPCELRPPSHVPHLHLCHTLHHHTEVKMCDFIEIVSILASNWQNAAFHRKDLQTQKCLKLA